MIEPEKKTCWVISDGRQGIENQALGLAEAIDRQLPLEISLKRLSLRSPFARLPSFFWQHLPLTCLKHVKDEQGETSPLSAPFPDLWIACGRLSVPYSVLARKKGWSFVVQIQDPKVSAGKLDLVIPPYHDELAGKNILSMHGAPNRLSEARLAGDAQLLAEALPDLPRPLFAILIGGNSKAYELTPENLREIIEMVQSLAASGAGVIITTSRRTGEENIRQMRESLRDASIVFWDGGPIGELNNPYFGMLGLADHILVTEESTNMITDAAFTGKPVHLLRLSGGHPKFERFHKALMEQDVVRRFAMPISDWAYTPLRETDRVALEVINRWQNG